MLSFFGLGPGRCQSVLALDKRQFWQRHRDTRDSGAYMVTMRGSDHNRGCQAMNFNQMRTRKRRTENELLQ